MSRPIRGGALRFDAKPAGWFNAWLLQGRATLKFVVGDAATAAQPLGAAEGEASAVPAG